MRILCLLLLLLPSVAWARPDYKYAYVTADGIRLRKGPGAGQPVVGTMFRGDLVGIIGRKAGWAEVVPLRVWVRTRDLDQRKIGPQGADLLLQPRADAAVLGHVTAEDMADGLIYRGKTYSMVEAPSRFHYFVADSYVTVRGVPVRPSDLVPPQRVVVSDADYVKLAGLKKGGLRMLVLPTEPIGTPKLDAVSSGRFGPSYTVKYQVGPNWYSISGATDGLGGADLDEPRYIVTTGLLGTVIVGPQNYGNSKEFMALAPALLGASTAEGKPYPLSVFFDCSPGLDEQVIRKVLKSLRAVRL